MVGQWALEKAAHSYNILKDQLFERGLSIVGLEDPKNQSS